MNRTLLSLFQNYLCYRTKDPDAHILFRAVWWAWQKECRFFDRPAPIWPDDTDAVSQKKNSEYSRFFQRIYMQARDKYYKDFKKGWKKITKKNPGLRVNE